MLSVLTELALMTGHGTGVLIRLAHDDRHLERVYAAILWTGCLGLLLNAGFGWMERRLAWYRVAALPRFGPSELAVRTSDFRL